MTRTGRQARDDPQVRGAAQPARLAVHQVVEVDLAPLQAHPALVGPREEQEVVDEPFQPADLGQDVGVQRRPVDDLGVDGRDLVRGPDGGQRAAQLVRGVGDERRCASVAAASRSSVSFIVRASWATWSRDGGTGTRAVRSVAVIPATRRRIASTGASARPVSQYDVAATSTSSTG